jgi:hypothetical protein
LIRSRLVPALVTWLALLGTAAPAIACAADMIQGDCCPAEQPAPCGEDERHAPSEPSPVACCVAAPATAQAPGLTTVRAGYDPSSGLDPPQPWVDGSPALLAMARPPIRRASFAPAGGGAGAPLPVYLLTARLRL